MAESMTAVQSKTKVLENAIKSLEKRAQLEGALGGGKGLAAISQKLTAYKSELALLNPEQEKAAGGVGGITNALAVLGPETGGITIAIAALVAVATAAITVFAGLAFEMAKFAIEQVGLREKLQGTFAALGGGEAAGQKTIAMFDELSSKLPQSREDLAQWTKQYQAMGLTDVGKLRTQLIATASAAALMEGGGESFAKLSKKI